MPSNFNVRVYGLLIHEGKILVSKEKYQGHNLVKFPGGGVEYGEGILETLNREFQEELQVKIVSHELFYLTDYFLQSAFKKEDQIIAIYYIVKTDTIDFPHQEHEVLWHSIDYSELETIGFTFEQEKLVFGMLCERL